MKRQLQKKHKVMIGVGTGILGAAAVATPLALTLTQNQSINLHNLDEVYGVDKSTYNKMKRDIYNNYAAKLEAESVDPVVASAKLEEMHSNLKQLDKHVSRLVKGKSSNNVYVSATSALMKIAKHDYDVDVVRTSRANWNEVQDMFDGMKDSFATYMTNHHFDDTKVTEVLAAASARYDQMMTQFKAQYDKTDRLGGVLKAKNQLISLFDTVNTEIAKLAGTIRLAEFMANYVFSFRDDAKSYTGVTDTNANRFEVLTAEGGPLQVGKAINENDMNKIFVCYNQETRQAIPFSSEEMIPGYTITPVYKGAIIDAEKNQYQIQIDWTMVSQNVDDADKEAATAHLVEMDNETVNNLGKAQKAKSVQSFDDIFNIANKVKLTNYFVLPSSSYATSQLENTYFNKSTNGMNIELTWDDPHAQKCYDGFMYAKQDSTETQKLSLRQLAQTGIVIRNKNDITSGRLLKDVVALVDQDNYEPKDHIEKFVKYCDIVDEITIAPNGIITNNVKATYINASNWKDTRFQDGNGVYELTDTPTASTDWDVSDDFFYEVNNSYNLAHKHAHLFMDKGYKKIKSKNEGVVAGTCITLSINWTITLVVGAEMVAEACQQKWESAIVHFSMWVMQAALCGYSTYCDHLYKTKYLDPIRDYKHRADDFEDSGAYDTVNKQLKKDNHWFILYDKDHPIDRESEQYKEKRATFNQNFKDKAKLQEIFNLYTYFDVDFAKDFFQKAYELKINPDKFKADFSNWRGPGDAAVQAWVCDTLTVMALTTLELMKDAMVPHEDDYKGEEIEADVEVQTAAKNGVEVAAKDLSKTEIGFVP